MQAAAVAVVGLAVVPDVPPDLGDAELDDFELWRDARSRVGEGAAGDSLPFRCRRIQYIDLIVPRSSASIRLVDNR